MEPFPVDQTYVDQHKPLFISPWGGAQVVQTWAAPQFHVQIQDKQQYVTGSGKRYIVAHLFKIELLAPRGRELSAIKCTTRCVVKVTCCGVMAVSVHSFLFTQRNNSSRKHCLKYYFRYRDIFPSIGKRIK